MNIGAKLRMIAARLRKEESPTRFLLGYILRHTGLSRYFLIRKEGYKMRFYPTSVSRAMWAYQYKKEDADWFINRYLKSGDTVVDVGANVGSIALMACTLVGDHGRIIAIEPHPSTFKYLGGNIRLNNFTNIESHNCAIGAEAGYLDFLDITSDDQNRIVDRATGDETIRVPVKTLSTIVKEVQVDLLKIDVEGYELFVLKGSADILPNTDVIYFESYDAHFAKYGYETGDVIKYLQQSGYKVYRMSRTDFQIIDESYRSEVCENLLAARDTVIDRVRAVYS